MAHLVGRIFMSIGAVGTSVVPYLADWNKHHNFGPGFSAHARLHAAESVFTSTGMGLVALWLIWKRPQGNEATNKAVATLIPVIHWGTYNLAALVPTTSVDDDNARVPRIFGVLPVNLMIQNLIAMVTIVGYFIDRVDGRRK